MKEKAGRVLSIGLPKGSLQDSTIKLFRKAGFTISVGSRSYIPSIDDEELSGLLIRAQEMARYVQDGILDLGLTGRDWVMEQNAKVKEVCPLQYAKEGLRPVRWVVAVPNESPIRRIEDLKQKRIATELVQYTRRFLKERGIEANVEFSWGATEVKAPRLADAIVELTRRIALGEGELARTLGQGVRQAAQDIGGTAAEYAMQVKGLEIPYHEPRLNQGLSIHYGVHAAGPDHVSGAIDNVLPRLMDNWNRLHVAETLPPTELSPRKARMAYELGLLRALPNYLGLCSFVPWNISEIRDAVEAVSGWPATTWKLMKAVERGITMMRIFNLREGFKREDDRLPERFYESPQAGPLKGVKIDPDAHREAVEVYYQLLGWNRDGVPTKACLTALDLEWAAPYLDA